VDAAGLGPRWKEREARWKTRPGEREGARAGLLGFSQIRPSVEEVSRPNLNGNLKEKGKESWAGILKGFGPHRFRNF